MEEIFKDIPGYESIYKVSNFGKIKNTKNVIIKDRYDSNGYLKIDLSKKG